MRFGCPVTHHAAGDGLVQKNTLDGARPLALRTTERTVCGGPVWSVKGTEKKICAAFHAKNLCWAAEQRTERRTEQKRSESAEQES